MDHSSEAAKLKLWYVHLVPVSPGAMGYVWDLTLAVHGSKECPVWGGAQGRAGLDQNKLVSGVSSGFSPLQRDEPKPF